MEFWNRINIPPPPNITMKCLKSNISTESLKKYKLRLHKLQIILLQDNRFNFESALLSRFIYRMKRRLRNDKSLNFLEKINKNVLNILNMRISHSVQMFQESLPYNDKLPMYLPSRQMLEFLLIRLYGLNHILINIKKLCKSGYTFWDAKLRSGHLWRESLIVVSLIARIWNICVNALQQIHKSFNALVPLQQKLSYEGPKFLPTNFLITKLDDLEIDNSRFPTPSAIEMINTSNTAISNKKKKSLKIEEIDFGEVIDRSIFETQKLEQIVTTSSIKCKKGKKRKFR